MSRVRDGVMIKLRRDVYEDLVRVLGAYASKHGEKLTYSDIIEALLRGTPDPVKAVEEYIKKSR